LGLKEPRTKRVFERSKRLLLANVRWYITVIHSLPIESWVVEDENHFGARPSAARA